MPSSNSGSGLKEDGLVIFQKPTKLRDVGQEDQGSCRDFYQPLSLAPWSKYRTGQADAAPNPGDYVLIKRHVNADTEITACVRINSSSQVKQNHKIRYWTRIAQKVSLVLKEINTGSLRINKAWWHMPGIPEVGRLRRNRKCKPA